MNVTVDSLRNLASDKTIMFNAKSESIEEPKLYRSIGVHFKTAASKACNEATLQAIERFAVHLANCTLPAEWTEKTGCIRGYFEKNIDAITDILRSILAMPVKYRLPAIATMKEFCDSPDTHLFAPVVCQRIDFNVDDAQESLSRDLNHMNYGYSVDGVVTGGVPVGSVFTFSFPDGTQETLSPQPENCPLEFNWTLTISSDARRSTGEIFMRRADGGQPVE